MKVLKMIGFVVAIAIGTASCKKDIKEIPAVKATVAFKRITKLVETYADGSKDFFFMTYDANGRPATYVSNDKKDVFSFLSPGQLLVKEYDIPGNQLSRSYECTLNEQGAITQMIFKNTAGVITYTYTYTYNAEGYMTGVKGTDGVNSFEETPELKEGNYIASKSKFSGGAVYNKQYIFSNIVNLQPGGFYAYWPVADLFGKPSKNLWTAAKTFKQSGELHQHLKANYTMAADGAVAQYTLDILTSGGSSVVDLSYE